MIRALCEIIVWMSMRWIDVLAVYVAVTSCNCQAIQQSVLLDTFET
jgi:hypothetical protein